MHAGHINPTLVYLVRKLGFITVDKWTLRTTNTAENFTLIHTVQLHDVEVHVWDVTYIATIDGPIWLSEATDSHCFKHILQYHFLNACLLTRQSLPFFWQNTTTIPHCKSFVAHSFNVVTKFLISTATLYIKMHGPPNIENCHSNNCCPACHHIKWSECTVIHGAINETVVCMNSTFFCSSIAIVIISLLISCTMPCIQLCNSGWYGRNTVHDTYNNLQGVQEVIVHLPYVFHYVCIHDLVTLCGNKHVTAPCHTNTKGCVFLLTDVHCATLTMADISNYCIDKHLVVSVWVHEWQLTVRQWIQRWLHFSL